ncbi:MAG: sulfotransferase family protein, partial [Candidatus Binatia bacterium]
VSRDGSEARAGTNVKAAGSDSCFAPAFIVGVGRSGTTLFVNLVGQHPLLAPIYETRFLRNLLLLCETASWYFGATLSRRLARSCCETLVHSRFSRACERYKKKAIVYNVIPSEGNGIKQGYESFPFGESHCIHYNMDEFISETEQWLTQIRNANFSPDGLRQSAREYVGRLFAIHCSRMNKPFWINKTPGLIRYLDLLPALFPNAKCIHIVRDGRDVAVSNLSLNWGPTTVREAARRWRDQIINGRRRANRSGIPYIEVRYEDLVKEPREVLRRTYEFLELDDASEIMPGVAVYKDRKEVWRSKLSPEERRVFAREAGHLLIEFGYAKDDSWV